MTIVMTTIVGGGMTGVDRITWLVRERRLIREIENRKPKPKHQIKFRRYRIRKHKFNNQLGQDKKKTIESKLTRVLSNQKKLVSELDTPLYGLVVFIAPDPKNPRGHRKPDEENDEGFTPQVCIKCKCEIIRSTWSEEKAYQRRTGISRSEYKNSTRVDVQECSVPRVHRKNNEY